MSIVRVVSAAWSRHHLQRMRRAAAIHNPQIARAMEDVPALLQEFWRESGPREFPGMSVSAKTWAWSLRGLLEYFHLAAKSSAQTILPSRAADSVWHAWLAFDPKGLERFQRRYFSKPLSHVPREDMPDTTSTHTALPRTWALASQYEGLPLTKGQPPFLFTIDREVNMPTGWDYQHNKKTLRFEVGTIENGKKTAYSEMPLLTLASFVTLGYLSPSMAAQWQAAQIVAASKSATPSGGCGIGMPMDVGSDSSSSSDGGGCGGGCGGD